MIRVLIVDDHAVLRSGLRLLVDDAPDMEVVGEAGDGASALDLIGTTQPDVVLLDDTLPDIAASEIIRRVRHGTTRSCDFLVLMMYIEERQLQSVLDAGAAGCVAKLDADADLLIAIRETHHRILQE